MFHVQSLGALAAIWFGLLTAVLAAKAVDPHVLLSRSFVLVRTGFGGSAACKRYFSDESSSFKYSAPEKGLSPGSSVSLAPQSFSLGPDPCDGDKQANVVFTSDLKAPPSSEASAFRYTVGELLKPEDPIGSVFEMIVGYAGNGSDYAHKSTAPSCRADARDDPLSLRSLLITRAIGNGKSATPVPDEFFTVKTGHMYAFLNLIPESDERDTMICIFSSKDQMWGRSSSERDDVEESSRKSVSSAMAVKIGVGVLGILIALAVILIGAYLWRKSTGVTELGAQTQCDDDECDTGEFSAA